MRLLAVLAAALLAAGAVPATAQVVFAPPIEAKSNGGGIDMLADDLNGDGHLDLVLEDYGLTARLGDGTGQFGPPLDIADLDGLGPLPPIAIDLDGNQLPDVLLGRGLDLADLSGDGLAELISAVPFPNTMLVVHAGLGDGTFGAMRATAIAPAEGAALTIDVGDVDVDGDLDLLVTPLNFFGSSSVEVCINNGGPLAVQPVALPSGISAKGARLTDVDADGLLDALVDSAAVDSFGGGYGHFVTAVMLAQPGGGFGLAAQLDDALAVDTGDIDGDGRVDVLASHPDGATLFVGLGDGSFAPGAVIDLPADSGPLALGDFDSDGVPDVLAHGFLGGVSCVRRGTGGGSFAGAGTSYSWGGLGSATFPVAADVDADGRTDLVALRVVDPQVFLATALNATYPAGSPLLDLGGALAGGQGFPIQLGHGSFAAGQQVGFALWGAPASGVVLDVVGLALLSASFKGGVLLPHPDVLVGPLVGDAAGTVSLTGTWPAGVPSGLVLYLQFWFADAGAVAGFAASSGVKVTVP